MIDFTQLRKTDDLDTINRVYSRRGNELYKALETKWFNQGVADGFANSDPSEMMWCQPYVVGLRVAQAELAELAEMVTA